MTAALIDDQLLSSVLRGTTPRPLRNQRLFTTGHWYVRLCQAVLRATERRGALSGPFEALTPQLRERAIGAVLDLPDHIGLLSLRDLAPTIGRLRARYDLNTLGVEAVAAATTLDARVFLSTPSPRLEAALAEQRLYVRVMP